MLLYPQKWFDLLHQGGHGGEGLKPEMHSKGKSSELQLNSRTITTKKEEEFDKLLTSYVFNLT